MNHDFRLTPHFALSEFTTSQAAARLALNNDPSEADITNLRRLAALLEAVRVTLGKPILITSGYRSEIVNEMVGGAKNSAHKTGRAADFVCPGYGSPREIVQRLSDSGLVFDKLILEFDNWVHIQVAQVNANPRGKVFTAFRTSGETVYLEGIA